MSSSKEHFYVAIGHILILMIIVTAQLGCAQPTTPADSATTGPEGPQSTSDSAATAERSGDPSAVRADSRSKKVAPDSGPATAAALERCMSRATDRVIERKRHTSESIRGLARCAKRDCGPSPGMPSQDCPDGVSRGGLGPCVRFPSGRCGWAVLSCPSDAVVQAKTPTQGICEALVSPTPSMRMSGAMGVRQLAKRGTDLRSLSNQFRELLVLNLQHASEDVQREMLSTLVLFDPKFIPPHQRALERQDERRNRFRTEQAARQEQRRREQAARRPPPPPPRQRVKPAPKRTLPANCPSLPNGPIAALPTGGGHRIVVTVFDYMTLAPLPGVPVTLKHNQRCSQHRPCEPTHAHPKVLLNLKAMTNKRGRVVFRTPDLAYRQPHISSHNLPSYLNYSSHYTLGAKQCHRLVKKHRGRARGTLGYDIFLVPKSMLEIRTRQEAIAAAHRNPEFAAFRKANPDAPMTVRGGGSAWQVRYARGNRLKLQAHINAFDGNTQVSGRWR